MILVVAAATIGIALAALVIAAAGAAVVLRALDRADLERVRFGDEDEFCGGRDPDWWPDFERRFAEYVES